MPCRNIRGTRGWVGCGLQPGLALCSNLTTWSSDTCVFARGIFIIFLHHPLSRLRGTIPLSTFETRICLLNNDCSYSLSWSFDRALCCSLWQEPRDVYPALPDHTLTRIQVSEIWGRIAGGIATTILSCSIVRELIVSSLWRSNLDANLHQCFKKFKTTTAG